MQRCIACREKLSEYGVVDGYRIFKCSKCGLGETEDKTLPDYQSYHRDTTYFKESEQFKNIFLKRLQVIEKFVPAGSVLEVGSSVGTLLALFKDKGWKVQGVEPSAGAFDQAIRRNIPTLKTTFEKAALLPESFNVVVFNHVLEHFEDAVRVLARTYKILKKGGIVLIDVPNFGGFGAKLQGTKWGYLYPAEHKWHFTKNSLLRLLDQTGFEVIHWETRSGVWDYGNPLLEIWQSFIGFKRRFIKNLLFLVPNYLVSVLGLGSGLTVMGRKK